MSQVSRVYILVENIFANPLDEDPFSCIPISVFNTEDAAEKGRQHAIDTSLDNEAEKRYAIIDKPVKSRYTEYGL